MTEKLTFIPDANLINRLGKELVAKQETALIELIKNSFDADATTVDVVLSADFTARSLEIIDDGTGMSREELIDGFLRLGHSLKANQTKSPKFNRQRAGSKGIGRFAAQRLGDRLTLTTRARNAQRGLRLDVNWESFKPGADLSNIEVELSDVDCDVGTSLRIDQLRDHWSEAQLKRCWRGIVGLQQPFPVKPIEDDRSTDPGFKVQIRQHSDFTDDDLSVIDMESEVLQHLHAVIEMRVNEQGCALWSLTKNRFGEDRPWQPIHHSGDKSAIYSSLRDVWMRAYYVILAPELLPSLVYSRVRDVLAEFGGVRLYRNGFRVVPYGDPGDDWLRLDELYAKRSLLVPVSNRNFFGVIEVHDTSGVLFEEHTSREGLIETDAFNDLKHLTSSVLVNAVTRIAEDRGKKSRAGRRPKSGKITASTAQRDPLSEVTMAIQAVSAAAEKAVEAGNVASIQVASEARNALEVFQARSSEVARAQADLADEANMLRFLATLGMTSAEFNHETVMTFDAFRLDFARIFEAIFGLAQVDHRLRDQAERAKAMLMRLDTLTSYMNSLASARAARGRSPVSLARAIEDFDHGIRLQAKSQNIEIVTKLPAYDPLFTQPMHQAEVASVLLNLYTNAVKAIKRKNQARKVHIAAERLPDSYIRLRFEDTGDGIPMENRDRVFDAFYTTNVAPPAGATDLAHATGTGLGLWIVHQIVDNAGGLIRVGEESAQFSTCIEVDLPAEKEDEHE